MRTLLNSKTAETQRPRGIEKCKLQIANCKLTLDFITTTIASASANMGMSVIVLSLIVSVGRYGRSRTTKRCSLRQTPTVHSIDSHSRYKTRPRRAYIQSLVE